MSSRRLMIAIVAITAAAALLFALHNGRSLAKRTQAASRVSKSNVSSRPEPLFSGTPLSANAELSGRAPSLDSSTGDVSHPISDYTGSIPSLNGVQPSAGMSTSADSSAYRPGQSNSQLQRPKFWKTDHDGYSLITDHEFVHTGSSSVIMESSSGYRGLQSTAATFQACSAVDFHGKHARFTIYVRGDEGFGSVEAWLRVDSPAQSKMPINVVRQPIVVSSPLDWVPASVEIEVASTATVLTYGVILHGPGPLWLDSAQLSVIEADGETREEPTHEPMAEEWVSSIGTVWRYPQNMDFETLYTPP